MNKSEIQSNTKKVENLEYENKFFSYYLEKKNRVDKHIYGGKFNS
jgi:hypothetical protein